MPGKPLTDLPVETLRDIVELVDQVDAVCHALTSHHLLGIVLAAKGASKLQDICPERTSSKAGGGLTLPWHGQTSTRSFTEHVHLMNRLWTWMGSEYLFCGRGS